MKDFKNFKFSSKSTVEKETCQEESLENLKSTPTRLLNHILILGNRYEYVFPNQTTLGKKSGIGRRQSNRIVKFLCQEGLLEKITRPNLTCVYRVPRMLLDPKIRQRFSHKFEAFRWLPLILLFSGLFYGDVSRSISADLFIKTVTDNLSTVYRYTDSKRTKKGAYGMYASEEQKKLILELKDKLNLSILGQIKLLPYPARCLEYVSEQYSRVNNPRDPFKIFTYLCNDWCTANDVKQDWAICYQLYKEMSIDPQGSFYAETKPKQQQIQISKEKKGYQKRDGQKPFPQTKPWSGHEEVKDGPFVAGYKRGDALEAQGLDGSAEYDRARKESKAPDYPNNPMAFRAAVNFARLAPDNIKAEWSEQYDKIPYKFDPPVVQVIKEWRIAQTKPVDNMDVVKSKMNPFMDVSLSGQQRLDEPPMIDYGSMEEIFDTNEVAI